MANKNNVNLKIKTYLKGEWLPIDEEMFVQIGGVICPIVDYACMIDGVWRYAPRSSYVWEKYNAKEIQQDYEWEYDDSDEKTFRISGSSCMPSDVYASISINENGEIYGVNEYRLGDLINKGSGGYYNDDGEWYYIDDIWHYVWSWQIPCGEDYYEKYYRYSDRERNRIKTGSGLLSINNRKIYGDHYEVIGSIPGGLEGYLDCYPIEVIGGPYVEKSELPIENVYADSRIYPIDGLHTDGYWYKLIKCPYIWNKYQANFIYNWSVYNAVSSNDKYEAYLSAIDGTVTKLLDIIKIDYNNNETAYCDDILDSKDIMVVKNLRNAAYKLPYFNNSNEFYKSFYFTAQGEFQGISPAYFTNKNVYVNVTVSSPEIKAGWYYLIGQNSKREYCLYSLSARPRGKSGTWTQGKSLIKKVSSTDINAYPDEKYLNGYWYVKEQDTITKTFIEKVESDYNDSYPEDGLHSDGYWYTLVMTGK